MVCWRGCLLLALSGCALETDPAFYLEGGPTPGVTTGAGDSTSAESGEDGSSGGSESGSSGGRQEPTMACAGESLGSSLGLAVVMDTTAQRSEDWTSACGDSSSPDAIYEWTAPADGTFSFDTSGSYYDTVVAVLAGCDGPEIACSDDAGEHLWSSVDVELTAGEKVLIVVDGWAEGDSGEFQLNIWQL